MQFNAQLTVSYFSHFQAIYGGGAAGKARETKGVIQTFQQASNDNGDICLFELEPTLLRTCQAS